jgi:hypothetical protein
MLVSASEVRETNLFLFNVGFLHTEPMLSQQGSSGTMSVFGPLRGLEFHAGPDDDVDVLIGMDVLGRGALHISFDGRFVFSW